MLVENNQQLYYIFFDSYIYQINISTQNGLSKQLHHTFLQDLNQSGRKGQKDKYQQFNHTSLDSYSISEQILL